jgi:4-aminobutyrate aminotransferase-like enzyme
MKETDLYSDLIQFVLNPSDYYSLKGVTKPHVFEARGIYLHTTDNLQIMDFTTGLSGCNLGHNHPDVLSAVGRLMEIYSRSAGYFDYSKIIFQLRDTVTELLPLDFLLSI